MKGAPEEILRELLAFLEQDRAHIKRDIRRLEAMEDRLYNRQTVIEEQIADLHRRLDFIPDPDAASKCPAVRRRARRRGVGDRRAPASLPMVARFIASDPASGSYVAEIDGCKLDLRGQRAPFILLSFLARDENPSAPGIVRWKTRDEVAAHLAAYGIKTSVNTLLGRLRDILEEAELDRRLVQSNRAEGLRFRRINSAAAQPASALDM